MFTGALSIPSPTDPCNVSSDPERRVFVSGTVMLKHVLKICEEDGNFDNVFL